jgi:hypothetical protein
MLSQSMHFPPYLKPNAGSSIDPDIDENEMWALWHEIRPEYAPVFKDGLCTRPFDVALHPAAYENADQAAVQVKLVEKESLNGEILLKLGYAVTRGVENHDQLSIRLVLKKRERSAAELERDKNELEVAWHLLCRFYADCERLAAQHRRPPPLTSCWITYMRADRQKRFTAEKYEANLVVKKPRFVPFVACQPFLRGRILPQSGVCDLSTANVQEAVAHLRQWANTSPLAELESCAFEAGDAKPKEFLLRYALGKYHARVLEAGDFADDNMAYLVVLCRRSNSSGCSETLFEDGDPDKLAADMQAVTMQTEAEEASLAACLGTTTKV